MRVKVLAFASASDALGGAEFDLELPAGAHVAALRAVLEARAPALAPLWPRLAIAIDGRLAPADAALAEGVEVALLPPVSGGSDRSDRSDRSLDRSPGLEAKLVDGPLDLAAAIAAVASPERGALVVFAGAVRADRREISARGSVAAPARPAIARIDYSAYRPMAATAIARIEREIAAATPDLALAIVHRLGPVAVGEISVVIAVAAPHRAEAYAASREALERLKREVPIWKREIDGNGDAEWREVEPLQPLRAPA